MSLRLIETTHLKTWASSKSAESRFPHIVKSLILAVIQPDKLRMPSGDAVWVPGFDGIVVNSEKNRFVPLGLSVWEAGTGSDIKGKADDDYNKRSIDKDEASKEKGPTTRLDRSEITFVFVTPRVWKDREDWITERKAESIWKDVVVVDGVDLQDWIESAPAVNLQFAAELGIVPEDGLQTLDQAWVEWSRLTDPPTSEELVVVGREEQEKELIDRMFAPPTTFIVRGNSLREAWGFVLASLRQIESEEKKANLYARTIIAENENVAGRLRNLENLLIVLKKTQGQVSGFLSSHGCHVIIPEGNDAQSERNVIILSRPPHRNFAEALGRMGLPEAETEHIARACGLSVTILQRLMPHANFNRPSWSEGENVVRLLPALLAGRWNDQSKADQEILCLLAGSEDYYSVEGYLQDFLWVDEPPLQKIGEMWTLTAPVDAFHLIARRLTKVNLTRFKNAFREVFGRIDPKVEIPPDEWIYYDIKGEKGHSGWLRSGMAEMLLLIAERGNDASLICVQSPQAYVDEVVHELPGLNNDWRILASLRDQYSLLMEAAPDPLLYSLEQLLEAKPSDVQRLFEEGEPFGGGNMYTGILWGLETMAWSPSYLSRIALILAGLSSLDPGGRLSNRPINSLAEIFLWWHPGTNATAEQRLAAIDLILAREPDAGWSLLAKLLPNAHSVSMGSTKPRWRDFGDLPRAAQTRQGQFQYLSTIIDRALDHLGSDPERWQAIFEHLGILNPIQQKKAMDLLDEIAQGEGSAEVTATLWEMLRGLTHRHRAFSDTNWALKGEVLTRLETILSRLAPDNPIERHRWLFDDWLPDLPFREEDIKQHQQRIEALRQEAVREILQAQGIEGLVTLGTKCKYPFVVAVTVVPLMTDLDTVHSFIEKALSRGENGVFFAGQVSGQAQRFFENKWRDLIIKEAMEGHWPPEVIASLIVWWPDGRKTWDDAAMLGEEVAEEYWSQKKVSIIDYSPEDQSYQIEQLIRAGRAADVFNVYSFQSSEVPTETLVRLFDATFDQLGKAKTAEEIQRFRLQSHNVRDFLDKLRSREDLSRQEIARREYQALPLLGPSLSSRYTQGLTIHELMAEDPNFFVELVCDVFLPAHRDKTKDVEPTPEESARAKVGYILLKGMNLIPGQDEGGRIDEAVLLQWITAARKKAAKVDRAVITDQQIGAILANTSDDPEDGGWPNQTVRNVIERLAADEIDQGLMIERYNMRGVVTKALYEGGSQERVLADQYHRWANISRDQWPRMAQVLEMMAKSLENDARREDIRAEQDKLE